MLISKLTRENFQLAEVLEWMTERAEAISLEWDASTRLWEFSWTLGGVTYRGINPDMLNAILEAVGAAGVEEIFED